MNLRLRGILLVGLVAVFSVAAQAGASFVTGPVPTAPTYPYGLVTINFDDLPGTILPIPNGYYNLNWNNYWYLDGVNYFGNPSGYQNGVVSPNNVAYNAFGNPASVWQRTADPFIVYSGFLTAAWNDGLQVDLTGYYAGNPVIAGSFLIDTSGPTFFFATAPVWIDTFTIVSSGGVNHGYSGSGTHYALDDLTVFTTPEPGTLLLVGTGLLGLIRKFTK